MKFFVIDANLLVSFFDQTDDLNKAAKEVLTKLLTAKVPHKIVVPRIVISETVVTLKTRGMIAKTVEEAISNFLALPYVVVLDISEMQIYKFTDPIPKRELGKVNVKANDYLNRCIGTRARRCSAYIRRQLAKDVYLRMLPIS